MLRRIEFHEFGTNFLWNNSVLWGKKNPKRNGREQWRVREKCRVLHVSRTCRQGRWWIERRRGTTNGFCIASSSSSSSSSDEKKRKKFLLRRSPSKNKIKCVNTGDVTGIRFSLRKKRFFGHWLHAGRVKELVCKEERFFNTQKNHSVDETATHRKILFRFIASLFQSLSHIQAHVPRAWIDSVPESRRKDLADVDSTWTLFDGTIADDRSSCSM